MSDLAIATRMSEIRSMLDSMAPQRPVSMAPQRAVTPVRPPATTFATQLAGATGSYAGSYDAPGAARARAVTSADAGGPTSGVMASLPYGLVGGVSAPVAPVGGPAGGVVGGAAVVAEARSYLGVPYRWGGTDPATGLDCSGLVQRVLGTLGVDVPRTVREQKDVGVPVASMAQARPGDLLVFGNHHIGIYVGEGRMLHAPKAGDVVKVADVYATPSSIRRVVEGSPAGALAASALPVTAPSLTGSAPTSLSLGAGTGAATTASARFEGLFSEATARYGLPQGLLRAVARTESGFDPRARSHAGALGLMQIMPGTARGLGVDPTDPAQAVDGAARLLRDHLATFGSLDLALAAYNAGPGAVRKYDGIPPYRETQGYVRKVLSAMGQVAA